MIEINLLPGAKKGKRSGAAAKSINFAAIGATISEKVKDKFLAAAIASGIAAAVIIGLMLVSQRAKESEVRAAEEKAVADSTRYAAVLADRARAQARRDSVLVQLNIIRAIDEDRFIWPHVLDEVSRALPQYTWVNSIGVAGQLQGVNPAAAFKMPAVDTTSRKRAPPLPAFPKDTVRMRLVGTTVDIQAFTRFMRALEDSPFLGEISMQNTVVAQEAGKDVTRFTVDMRFTRPDTLFLRREAFTASATSSTSR